MQSIFSQTEYPMKTKVCSIPKVKVQQNRFNLHEILVLRGSKVEKAIFLHFCIKKAKIYHVIYDAMKQSGFHL